MTTQPDPAPLTIDTETGQWLTDRTLTNEQSCRIAASVMPGWTPDVVDTLYNAWLVADGQTVGVLFHEGRITVASGGTVPSTVDGTVPTAVVDMETRAGVDPAFRAGLLAGAAIADAQTSGPEDPGAPATIVATYLRDIADGTFTSEATEDEEDRG